MDKLDLFKKLLIEQQEGLVKLINKTANERTQMGLTALAILESEKRTVDRFILLLDALQETK